MVILKHFSVSLSVNELGLGNSGTEDKNPPSNAGNIGSVLGPGKFHLLQSKLSSCITTTETACCSN